MARKATVGQAPRTTYTITDYDDVLADPATFFVEVRDPDGNVATYTRPDATITDVSTGIIQFIPPPFDDAGAWIIEAHSTNPATIHSEVFQVAPQRIPTP